MLSGATVPEGPVCFSKKGPSVGSVASIEVVGEAKGERFGYMILRHSLSVLVVSYLLSGEAAHTRLPLVI